MSFKAIETPETDDDTQWLMYWVVFTIFLLIDKYLSWFIEPLIPFYCLFELGVLLFLFWPGFRGAQYLYKFLIAPILRTYERIIDPYVKKGEKTAVEISDNIKEAAPGVIAEGAKQAGKLAGKIGAAGEVYEATQKYQKIE